MIWCPLHIPNIGTFSWKIFLSGIGAPESYTLDGPPEKIIPFGFSLVRFSKEMSNGTSSAYTE